jgi:1-deoxy-D-xylulose-5-phosphate synthase
LSRGDNLAILATGAGVQIAREAAILLASSGISATVVNVRRLHPLDSEALLGILESHSAAVTVEENALAGGFGSAILELLKDADLAVPVARVGLPDRFVDQGPVELLREIVGLTPENVSRVGLALLNGNPTAGS